MINHELLTGTVERITYYNPENGYTVIKIQPDGKYPNAVARDGTVAVVGTMPEIAVGETVQFTGNWIEDPRYGKQFRARRITPVMPTSTECIINLPEQRHRQGSDPRRHRRSSRSLRRKDDPHLDKNRTNVRRSGHQKELIKDCPRVGG
jgi:exodeoxyribonuclease V alpha subunit